jgi:hypothetical protein
LGSLAEMAAFSRIQKVLASATDQPRSPDEGVSGIDLRDRRVSTHERRVEVSAVEYRLLCHLAGEPARVLTKVNFETRPAEGKGSEGFRDLGAGLVIHFPLGRLWPLDYQASSFLGFAHGGFGPQPFRD